MFTGTELKRAAGVALIAGVIIGGAGMNVVWHNAETPVTECVSEDATPDEGLCVWDASKHGNGEGTSFIVDADGNVYTLSH